MQRDGELPGEARRDAFGLAEDRVAETSSTSLTLSAPSFCTSNVAGPAGAFDGLARQPSSVIVTAIVRAPDDEPPSPDEPLEPQPARRRTAARPPATPRALLIRAATAASALGSVASAFGRIRCGHRTMISIGTA